MTDSNYQLPTEGSSGKLLDHEQLSIGGALVQRQRVQATTPRALIATSFTRPGDTTTYAAGDAMSNSTSAPTALTFANMARFTGGGGMIRGATLLDSGNQATKLDAELWLFTQSPGPDNDNAVFTPTDAELANLVGIITFKGVSGNAFVGDATSGAGGNVVILGSLAAGIGIGMNLNINYTTVASTSLFGLVVARNAYVPLNAEILTFSLIVDRE